MRRSFSAGIGVAAVIIVAACSPDQPSREPLAPTIPSLAQSQQCAGQLASTISKQQKVLFTGLDLADMQDRFDDIQRACDPNDPPFDLMMDYIDAMIGYRDVNKAAGLVEHLGAITEYVTNSKLVRPASVMGATGGADVLVVTATTGDAMVTFDSGARLAFDAGTEAILQKTPSLVKEPFGKRLFTFEPKSSTDCEDVTSLRPNSRGDGAPCYNIEDYSKPVPAYPDGALEYSPAATLSFCMLQPSGENRGILHDKSGYGEVLPSADFTYDCGNFHASTNSWLERNGGPLGRVLARAYNYVAPRTLFADDVGESGSIGDFSLVGGILNDIFKDDFDNDDSASFNDGVDTPDLGDGNWLIKTQTPGYIRIQNALGNMSGGVVVLSQGQGACDNCPLFRLLGTRKNAGENEAVGSYAITWTSLQNKPSVKEAPFVILNAISSNSNTHNKNIEIARLSYVSVNSQNKLRFIVRGSGNNDSTTYEVGEWVKDSSQTFTVTVNLTMLNSSLSQTISLSIDGNPVELVPNDPEVGPYLVDAPRATLLKQIGYVLAGIDAGVIASDNWLITRLPDIPPE